MLTSPLMPVSALTAASPSRTQRRQERNRAALTAAARRLFALRGFEHTTIAEIAAEAVLGFGTFYRYFEDKEAVLDAVIEEARLEIEAVIGAESNEQAPPAEALSALTERMIRSVGRNKDMGVIIGQLEPSRRPPFPTMFAEAIERIVRRGMAGGDFAKGDARLVARMLMGSHLMLLFPPEDARTDDATIAELQAFSLRALGVEPAVATETITTHGRETPSRRRTASKK